MTESEIVDRAGILADKIASHTTLAVEAKEHGSDYRKRLKRLEGEIETIGKEIENRSTERDVAVEERPDFRAGIAEIWRLDTNPAQKIGQRELSFEERQMGLKLGVMEGGKVDEPPPPLEQGRCRYCNCTNDSLCVLGEAGEPCAWVSAEGTTLCTNPDCMAKFEEANKPAPLPENVIPMQQAVAAGAVDAVPAEPPKRKRGRPRKTPAPATPPNGEPAA